MWSISDPYPMMMIISICPLWVQRAHERANLERFRKGRSCTRKTNQVVAFEMEGHIAVVALHATMFCQTTMYLMVRTHHDEDMGVMLLHACVYILPCKPCDQAFAVSTAGSVFEFVWGHFVASYVVRLMKVRVMRSLCACHLIHSLMMINATHLRAGRPDASLSTEIQKAEFATSTLAFDGSEVLALESRAAAHCW